MRSAIGTVALAAPCIVPLGGSRADLPPPAGKPPVAPPRPPAPAPRAAWINFEYAITWERVDVLQEIVTGLVGRGVTDITLLISSNGGDVAAAISTYTFLTSAGIRLTTYNVGNVYSAAVVLFLAGERRVVDAATQVVIHPPALNSTAGSSTLDDLNIKTEALIHESGRMREIILARTHMEAAQLDPMLTRASFIDPRKALEFGLATEVGHLTRPAGSLLITLPLPNRALAPAPAVP